MKREDIRIRDPFVLTDEKKKKYYMYGTTDIDGGRSFSVYVSEDLENFEPAFVVFDGEKTGFWATTDYWAAEVHFYRGKYYLFGSFRAENVCRGTQILVADNPKGPFAPISSAPQTPLGDACLDGTLWVENGVPYLVYCHEWLQVYDGEICAVRLSEDLRERAGEPFRLFKASENPFVTPFTERDGNECYVTDGPFLYKENGKVQMLWSSFIDGHYAVLRSCAESIRGKWSHCAPLYTKDGGHSMLFLDLQGRKRLALHAPNAADKERAVFLTPNETLL